MNRKKYCQCIYLTEEERYILEEKTKLSGMRNFNAYIRHLIKYGFVYQVDYSYLDQYSYQLGKIGNNLNQIAHVANATGSISQKQIDEVKEIMNKIWQLQESMLSKQPFIKQ